MNRNLQRYKVAAVIAVLAALAPVEFSAHGVSAAKASCSDGTCCPEAKSDCIINNILVADSYRKTGEGKCTQLLPHVPG